MVDYDDLLFSTGRHKRRGLLHFDLDSPSSSMEFRPKQSAAQAKPPVRINPAEISESWWAQVHDGFQWRLHLRGLQFKLIGFPERALNDLQALMKACGKEIQEEVYSTKGRNGGEFLMNGKLIISMKSALQTAILDSLSRNSFIVNARALVL